MIYTCLFDVAALGVLLVHHRRLPLGNPLLFLEPSVVVAEAFSRIQDGLVHRVELRVLVLLRGELVLSLHLEKVPDLGETMHTHKMGPLKVAARRASHQIVQMLHLFSARRIELLSGASVRWFFLGHRFQYGFVSNHERRVAVVIFDLAAELFEPRVCGGHPADKEPGKWYASHGRGAEGPGEG